MGMPWCGELVGAEEADPTVARVVALDADESIELEILPGAVESDAEPHRSTLTAGSTSTGSSTGRGGTGRYAEVLDVRRNAKLPSSAVLEGADWYGDDG